MRRGLLREGRASARPFEHNCPRAAFTVVELMVVIGVFSLLLSILLPVFRTVRKATLKARAKVEATALVQAVVQYKNVYGYWPGMVKESAGLDTVQENTFSPDNRPDGYANWPIVSTNMFTINVRLSDGTEKAANYLTDNVLYRSLLPFNVKNTSKDNLNPLNPRRIRFLSLSDETDPDRVSFPDPWGNQYIVVMGLTPSTQFRQIFSTKSGSTIQTLSVSNLTAFAICLGPDGENSTNFIYSAGVPQ